MSEYKAKHFDKDKLARNLDELLADQLNTGWSESTEQFIGCALGHAIKVIVTREEEVYDEAEERLEEYPDRNCIAS